MTTYRSAPETSSQMLLTNVDMSQNIGASSLEEQVMEEGGPVQRMATYASIANGSSSPIQRQINPEGGLPTTLQSGIESLSGIGMGDVKVHYNSSKPAQLQAHAYAQGTDIHIAPGQERHLPHEAWHVVQQKQGRVKPTLQLKGVAINDNEGLEREADVMGARAMNGGAVNPGMLRHHTTNPVAAQLQIDEKALQEKLKQGLAKWNPNYLDSTGRLFRAIMAYNAAEGKATLDEVFKKRRRLKRKHLDTYQEAINWLDTKLESEALRHAPAPPGNANQQPVANPAPLVLNLLPEPVGADDDEPVYDEVSDDEVVDEKAVKPKAKKAAEFETVLEQDIDSFRADAKVGLELTFQNAKSKQYLTNAGFPKGQENAAKGWWRDMCARWTNGLQPPDGDWSVDVKDGEPNKDFGGGTGQEKMKVVIYTNDTTNEVLWWQLSMDPSVIEIQTSPATADDMEGGVMEFILGDIYKRAAQNEFKAEGGGGHLNIDFATGFGGDWALIPKVLMATEDIIAELRESKEDGKLVDWGNEPEDPFIRSERYIMAATTQGDWDSKHEPKTKPAKDHSKSWMNTVGKLKPNNKPSLEKFRLAHAKWLLLHPTVAQYNKHEDASAKITGKGDDDGLAAVLHYQAVNIDHLFDEVEAQRRVEFRFLKSQQSLQEIIAGIETIAKIVSMAKQNKK